MRSKDISVSGMVSATLICLVGAALGMTAPERCGNLCLVLLSIALLIFYVSVAMPIRLKRGSSDNS